MKEIFFNPKQNYLNEWKCIVRFVVDNHKYSYEKFIFLGLEFFIIKQLFSSITSGLNFDWKHFLFFKDISLKIIELFKDPNL